MADYATKQELADYLEVDLNDITEHQEMLLSRASRFVDTKTRNPDGVDTEDESVAKQAVLEQVEWWIATGDENEQLQYLQDFDVGEFEFDEANLPSMCPKAKRTLVLNGLLDKGVKSTGSRHWS